MDVHGETAPSQGKDSQGDSGFAIHPLSSLLSAWNGEVIPGSAAALLRPRGQKPYTRGCRARKQKESGSG